MGQRGVVGAASLICPAQTAASPRPVKNLAMREMPRPGGSTAPAARAVPAVSRLHDRVGDHSAQYQESALRAARTDVTSPRASVRRTTPQCANDAGCGCATGGYSRREPPQRPARGETNATFHPARRPRYHALILHRRTSAVPQPPVGRHACEEGGAPLWSTSTRNVVFC